MEKIDVAIQSFNKPESLIYTLLSLKKYCGHHIDTIYIDDDKSEEGVVEKYFNPTFLQRMSPITIKVRVNNKKSGYTHTCMTKEAQSKKTFIEKIRLKLHRFIHRIEYYETSDDIRYQWGINSTDKRCIMLIHDDIKFFDDVVGLYMQSFSDDKMAIVGDLGGSRRCEYGPCGSSSNCSPKKIMEGKRPSKKWPLTGGYKSLAHFLLGRKTRHCRINEWCCILNVEVCKKLEKKFGVFFGNYEGGGDVGCFWFEKAIKEGYKFCDPLPCIEQRKKYYLHWWQGYEGHSVWVEVNGTKNNYEKEMILRKLKEDFNFSIN